MDVGAAAPAPAEEVEAVQVPSAPALRLWGRPISCVLACSSSCCKGAGGVEWRRWSCSCSSAGAQRERFWLPNALFLLKRQTVRVALPPKVVLDLR
eukprot:1158410-Pelagomonas_calceolata.AAC.9